MLSGGTTRSWSSSDRRSFALPTSRPSSVRKMKSPKLKEDFMNDLIPSSIESEAFRTNAALTLDASRSISGWYDCRSTGMSGWRPLTWAAKSIPARSFGAPSLGKSMSEMTPRIASR